MTAPNLLGEQLQRTTIEGDVDVDLRDAAATFDLVERRCRTRCSSGDRFEGSWRGIPLADLLTGIDPDSTHLLVEAEDGFRACIDIAAALDGVVALERLDDRTDDGPDGLPRLVVPGCLGTRMVKRVARIETRRLDPDADPEEFERLDPASTPR